MNRRPPLGRPAASAGSRTTSPAAVSRPARRLIGVMLIAAAALDLTRCGLVMVAVRQPAPAAGLVVAGLAAAALSVRTARGCQGGQRWAVWAALLTGAASAPQAAVSGFSTPYTIPDMTAAASSSISALIPPPRRNTRHRPRVRRLAGNRRQLHRRRTRTDRRIPATRRTSHVPPTHPHASPQDRHITPTGLDTKFEEAGRCAQPCSATG